MEKTINEVCLSKRTYTLNTGFLEGTDMKRHRIRQWVLVGICGGALLLAGGLGYGYVTDFRPGSPVYSSLAAYRDQVAETGEELFTYTNDTVYAAVRDVGGDTPYLDVQILEKRLFWWTLRHFESAYYPVMPVKVGDQVLLIGSYTGWNAGEAAKVRLRGENGEIRLPRKQERFLCRGASYLGYAFDMDPDFRGGWRIEYLDKEGDPLPELSPRSVNDAAVRRVVRGRPDVAIDKEAKEPLLEEAALLFAAGEPSEPFSPAGTALVLDILVTELHPGPLYRSGEAYTRLLFSLLDDGRLGILTEAPEREPVYTVSQAEVSDAFRAALEP